MKRSKSVFAIFVIPAFILYTLFMLYPLISSLGLSFFSWTGYGPKTYVGFDNFIKLFARPEHFDRFIGAIINNIKFFIFTILFQNIVGLILAAFINSNIKGAKFFRSIYFIPTTLSIIVVGFLWKLIYNPIWGPLNVGLRAIGLENVAKAWLGNESTALLCVSIANAWQYVGIPIILFLAGIQGIPEELYESSELDGATGFKQFWKITFPLIAPVIFIITTIVFVSNFSAFEIIYAMTGTLGAPNYSTDILGTLFYRICFGQRLGTPPDMGLGAVIASCMFFIICIGVVIWFKIYGDREGSF